MHSRSRVEFQAVVRVAEELEDLSSLLSSSPSSMVVLLPPLFAFPALPNPLTEAALAPRVAERNATLATRAADLAGSAPSLLLLLLVLLMAVLHVRRSCLAARSGRVVTAAWTTACSSLAPSSTARSLRKQQLVGGFVRSQQSQSRLAAATILDMRANLHVLRAQLTFCISTKYVQCRSGA